MIEPIADPEERFNRRTLRGTAIVIAVAGAAYALVKLSDLLLLLFACVLIALILLTVTNKLRARVKLPFGLALAIVFLSLVALVVGATVFFGTAMTEQFTILYEKLPAAIASVQNRLSQYPVFATALQRLRAMSPETASIVATVRTVLSSVAGILSALAVVIVGGVYLAAQPRLYRRGTLALLPDAAQSRARALFAETAAALKAWLKGQAIGMAFVGVAYGIGFAIVGLPAAAAFGLMAGIAEFVPYLSVLVGIPALMLGFAQGTDTGLWTVLVLLVVSQVHGNIVMPMVQSSMVDLPPALTIFSLVAAGVLLGPLGVILAVPLTVVALVMVKSLYLHQDPAKPAEVQSS